MRTWEHALANERCGFCGTPQPAETPVLVIVLPALGPASRRRIRCQGCARSRPDLDQVAAAVACVDAETLQRRDVLARNQAALAAALQAETRPDDDDRRDGKLWGAGAFLPERMENEERDGETSIDTSTAAAPAAIADAAGYGEPRHRTARAARRRHRRSA
jgi:hypothetical protein